MTKSMTQGGPARLIFLFALPLLGGNLFQQFYNMMDALIVGNILGENALAAVGCTGSIMFLIIGFVQGMTSGLSIVTARHFGANDLTYVRQKLCGEYCDWYSGHGGSNNVCGSVCTSDFASDENTGDY